MNIATYTRAIAAAFLNVHRSALYRVAAAADRAAEKAYDDVDRSVEQANAIQAALAEARAVTVAKERDALVAVAKADAVAQAVSDELALLPYNDR